MSNKHKKDTEENVESTVFEELVQKIKNPIEESRVKYELTDQKINDLSVSLLSRLVERSITSLLRPSIRTYRGEGENK